MKPNCPLCGDDMESREVSPCMDCGWDPVELDHLDDSKHTYHELEVLPGHRLVLCNFCMVDFGSYEPEYFGLPKNYSLGYEHMKMIRDVANPKQEIDSYCATCKGRSKFLNFVATVRTEGVSTDVNDT